jgi:hypothetical protein
MRAATRERMIRIKMIRIMGLVLVIGIGFLELQVSRTMSRF